MFARYGLGLVLCAMSLGAGCATVAQGPLQRIEIESNVKGAAIEARDCGVTIGPMQTPATILVSRRATRCEITVSHPRYWGETVQLTRRVSGAALGNLELGEAVADSLCCDASDDGIVAGMAVLGAGMLIDYGSGAMYQLEPSRIFIPLQSIDEAWREESDDEGAAPDQH